MYVCMANQGIEEVDTTEEEQFLPDIIIDDGGRTSAKEEETVEYHPYYTTICTTLLYNLHIEHMQYTIQWWYGVDPNQTISKVVSEIVQKVKVTGDVSDTIGVEIEAGRHGNMKLSDDDDDYSPPITTTTFRSIQLPYTNQEMLTGKKIIDAIVQAQWKLVKNYPLQIIFTRIKILKEKSGENMTRLTTEQLVYMI